MLVLETVQIPGHLLIFDEENGLLSGQWNPAAGRAYHRPVMAAIDHPTPQAADWDVEVFYDGDCPLCRREIDFLRRWDRKNRIRFTDIAAARFDPSAYGMDFDQFMAEIQGRLPTGEWIRGVEVFRRLYTAVGFGWPVAVTRWPGIRHGLDWAYRLFARNRLRWTGRCTADCRVESTR